MSPFPPRPAYGALRLARPSDILRLGIVAVASLYYTPQFRWERPRHNNKLLSRDTLLAYRHQFKDAMMRDDAIVLVAEDAFDPKENEHTDAVTPPSDNWIPPNEGERVIVGVVSIKLERGSMRRGQFTYDGDFPQLTQDLGRDVNKTHRNAWGKHVDTLKQKHCRGYSFMELLAVHPAYWRRGHGIRLVTWSANLSQLDVVNQGVIATPMAEKLFKGLEYILIDRRKVPGDQDDPEGAFVDLLALLPPRAIEG
ncbi:Acyl-CoA N-acyltransferase [Cordyceps fumosorosea ARSEF 2679]|uniref:Acyl-CoA N-acyltransferase n=1 Tax=Cordyceps fumosorosea (strain ARSEF 2679) TaxID=1081104 RepID=A0A168ENE2_CORFA|nr:Acyl-CoA N-acyltransferase [Cordyceps fumosorosea ARSEF 2679]OAA74023.1 Acyl-CoA N-acyltransferase [Cordyceps fumosorosea ARSEF 2679]